MKKIPSIIVPLIDNGNITSKNLSEYLENKKVVIFGVPGAFTPTCSELHLPGFIKLSDKIKNRGVDEIICLSVNDKFVMQAWMLSYSDGDKIKAIADGNAEVTKSLNMLSDKSESFMGYRCLRFAMIVDNSTIQNVFIEDAGKLNLSSAESILSKL